MTNTVTVRESVRSRLKKLVLTPPIGPFQEQGVRFLEKRDGNALLGDDMGLGKTWQTIAHMLLHHPGARVTIVCPATLKWNWQRELLQHGGIASTVLEGFKQWRVAYKFKGKRRERRFRTPEERRHWISSVSPKRAKTYRVPAPALGRVNIVNYDILDDWVDDLVRNNPEQIVLDECHRLMNRDTRRTKNCKKLCAGRKVLALSGTPITSRPMQFFPVLHMLDPKTFNSFTEYGFRFCGVKLRNGTPDFRGASNLEDLNKLVKPLMLRRMKSEVMTQLPRKLRTVIPVDMGMEAYKKAKSGFIRWLTAHQDEAENDKRTGTEKLTRLGELLRLAGLSKLPVVVQWVKEWLEEDRKLVLFATHYKVIDALVAKFPGCAVVTGKVTGEKRQHEVDKFQNDPKCRLFIGNIYAASEGISLTASSAVAFAELSWVPAHHDQAEDRVLRIGQEASHVDAFYFVAKDSIEEQILALHEQKREVIRKVLGGVISSGDIQNAVVAELLKGA